MVSVDGSKTHFSTTVQVNLWDGVYGGHVEAGQELAGSTGAAASLVTFVDNQLYDQNFNRPICSEQTIGRMNVKPNHLLAAGWRSPLQAIEAAYSPCTAVLRKTSMLEILSLYAATSGGVGPGFRR